MSLIYCKDGMRLLDNAVRAYAVTQERNITKLDLRDPSEADRLFSQHCNCCPVCNDGDRGCAEHPPQTQKEAVLSSID
jgi:hypothetical protein